MRRRRRRQRGIAAARDMPGMDKLIQVARAAQTPDLLEDAYLVILSIPPATGACAPVPSAD
jgi:hypothetical protein